MELAIHEDLEEISIERISGADGESILRIHIDFHTSRDELISALRDHGLEKVSDDAVTLFSNDEITRVYETKSHFVLVRRAAI